MAPEHPGGGGDPRRGQGHGHRIGRPGLRPGRPVTGRCPRRRAQRCGQAPARAAAAAGPRRAPTRRDRSGGRSSPPAGCPTRCAPPGQIQQPGPARAAIRSPVRCTSIDIGVSGPVSPNPAATNTGKRGSIRLSNSPSAPSAPHRPAVRARGRLHGIQVPRPASGTGWARLRRRRPRACARPARGRCRRRHRAPTNRIRNPNRVAVERDPVSTPAGATGGCRGASPRFGAQQHVAGRGRVDDVGGAEVDGTGACSTSTAVTRNRTRSSTCSTCCGPDTGASSRPATVRATSASTVGRPVPRSAPPGWAPSR